MSPTHPEPPPGPSRGEITRLLLAYHEANQEAFQQLESLVYDELRRIARRQIARGGAARNLHFMGRWDEAEPFYREALSIRRRRAAAPAGARHPARDLPP